MEEAVAYNFGKASRERLDTCHANLQYLFNHVVENYDCTVLPHGGHRTKEEQAILVEHGQSETIHSKHCDWPSNAVDVSPWPIPEDWGETNCLIKAQFYFFAGYVKRVAEELGIKVRWGGDWDSDTIFIDQKFNDLVHWELE